MKYILVSIITVFCIGIGMGYYFGLRMFKGKTKRGVLVIDSTNIDKDLFSFEIDTFQDIEKSKYVLFSVKNVD